MINLSQSDLDIIAEHPLNKCLDYLQNSFRKAKQNQRSGALQYDDVVNNQNQGSQKAISRFLYILQGHEAAFNFRSKIGNGDLISELFTLFKRVRTGSFNYQHYRPLSQFVIKKASDVNIWSAVFELIITVFRTTFSTNISVFFEGIFIIFSFASQQSGEQTRKLVKARIFEEIKECTYRNVGGFFFKYFEEKNWTEQIKEIYRVVQNRHVNDRWTDFPDSSIQNAVFEWLFRFQKEFLVDFQGVYYTNENSNDLTGAEVRRQLDVFVKPNGKNISKTVHDWKDVEVIGELREFDKEWKVKLLQLSRYMRDVFATQPTRRFVHGFTFFGCTMELWIFDRFDFYSSEVFDIHKKSEQFIRAIAEYTMMNDEELDLNIFTNLNEEYRFIIIIQNTTDKKKRLQLKIDPIVYQRAIVCRGTFCFRARTVSFKDLQYVAKFFWVFDKRRPKIDLFRLTREREVEKVVKLFDHHRITSIADMRERLKFEKPYAFRNIVLSFAFFFSQSQSLLSQSFGQRFSLNTAEKSSKKRKFVDVEKSSSKRSKFNSQSADKVRRNKKINSQTTSLYTHNDSSFDNRIFGCLMISPAGRAIRDFWSILKLLKALRDAIKAHKSLYAKGKILHRDISKNNIIITNSKKADDFKSMLIDEDLAKKIDSGRSGARHQTGTMEFMTIEVLQRIVHTYRHDLESFFYVLLWMCARRTWEREFKCKPKDRLKKNILSKWYTGSFDDIANAKQGYMHVDKFEDILKEFSQAFDCVKPLCKTIRGILFPYKNGLIIEISSDSSEELYDSIIEAFDNVIADIPPREDSE